VFENWKNGEKRMRGEIFVSVETNVMCEYTKRAKEEDIKTHSAMFPNKNPNTRNTSMATSTAAGSIFFIRFYGVFIELRLFLLANWKKNNFFPHSHYARKKKTSVYIIRHRTKC